MNTTRDFLNTKDARVYYEVTGSGPAIIFAHGLGGNYLSWWQQIPYFSKNFTCITLSHQGFYPSTGSPDLEKLSENLSTLVEHLQLNKIHLVAQSMGGWGAIQFALHQPEKIASITLSGSIGPLKNEKLDEIVMQNIKNQSSPIGEKTLQERPELSFLYSELSSMSRGIDRPTMLKKIFQGRYVPVEKFAQLNIPMLFVAGGEDTTLPPTAMETLASLIPHAMLSIIPQSGHSTYFEKPEVFNTILEAFLKTVQNQ